MNQPYYPASNAGAILWLNNYKNQIATQGPIAGLTAAQIAQQISYVQKLMDGIHDIQSKKDALSSAVASFKTIEINNLLPLKKLKKGDKATIDLVCKEEKKWEQGFMVA